MSAAAFPPRSVGRALLRIGRALGAETPSATASGASRAAILRILEASAEPMRVEQIAGQVGLHANTVRGHLDLLLAAGQISRIPDRRTTRGRPHFLYRADTTDTVGELAHALQDELELADASEVARRAAAAWAAAGPQTARADTLDEAVDVATEAMRGFGFDAVRNPVGDQITLRSCPYANVVAEHPVICTIHAELLREVLGRTGQPVSLEALDVFPRPGMCVARLRRADAQPQWSVALAAAPPATPPAAQSSPGAPSPEAAPAAASDPSGQDPRPKE